MSLDIEKVCFDIKKNIVIGEAIYPVNIDIIKDHSKLISDILEEEPIIFNFQSLLKMSLDIL